MTSDHQCDQCGDSLNRHTPHANFGNLDLCQFCFVGAIRNWNLLPETMVRVSMICKRCRRRTQDSICELCFPGELHKAAKGTYHEKGYPPPNEEESTTGL